MNEVTYRCWCKDDDCDWEREVTNEQILAQEEASTAMAGHAVAENHFQTRMEIV